METNDSKYKEFFKLPSITLSERCSNPQCVTRQETYLNPQYEVISKEPRLLSCIYAAEQFLETLRNSGVSLL